MLTDRQPEYSLYFLENGESPSLFLISYFFFVALADLKLCGMSVNLYQADYCLIHFKLISSLSFLPGFEIVWFPCKFVSS